jgi:hypothetical protein
MKNRIKLFGIAAIITTIGFLTAACDTGISPGGPPGPIPRDIFTSVAELKTWLEKKPANTASNPYEISLEVSTLDSFFKPGSLGDVLIVNKNKYVSLDLSASISLNSIKENTFISCNNITRVYLPYGIKSIEKSAFLFCLNLAAIDIAETVTSIGEGAFCGCTSLASVTFE